MISKLLALLVLFPAVGFSAPTPLLSVPMNESAPEVFSVNQTKKCSFEGVNEVIQPNLDVPKEVKDNVVTGTLNEVQKKINLKIENQKIQKDKISFNLSGSKNLTFEFSYKDSNNVEKCKLQKFVIFDEERHEMDTINIDYDDSLDPPVVKKIIIKDATGRVVEKVFPMEMKGQIAAYEFLAGPVFNIHSNYRNNNQKRFERTHPVVKPIPGFLFRYGPLFLNREGLGTLAYHTGDLNVLVMAVLKGEAHESGGLRERRERIFAGSTLQYKFVNLTYYQDYFSNNGMNLKLNFAPSYRPLLKWKISPQVYAQYWDDRYVDYYFGVKSSESSSGLPVYKGNSTMNYGSVVEVHHYDERWTYITAVGAKFFGKEVYNSPTMAKKHEVRLILSALYKIF